MATRNLVPRGNNEGSLGIDGQRWSALHVASISTDTLKVTNIQLKANDNLSLFTKGAGIEDITTNGNGQFVIQMDSSFLEDLGFNTTTGLNAGFTRNNGDALTNDDSIASGDSLKAAIQKLNDDVRGVAVPTTLTVGNFAPAAILEVGEDFVDGDDHLMTSGAINDRIESFGYGDITSVTAEGGLSGGGNSGAVTLSIADQNNGDNGGFDAGTFGSASAIPQITVNQKGIITGITTQTVATELNITGDNDANDAVKLKDDTLDFEGGLGITTAVSDNKVAIALDSKTISLGGVSIDLGGTDATPAFDLQDATGYPTTELTGTITNAQLAGSIANDKLANNTVSYGGVQLSLGGEDATPAFNLQDATGYPTSSLTGTITNAQLAGSISNDKLATIDSANTASNIVVRDESGNFAAGTITATLSGNASSASTADQWDQARTVTFAGGDVTGSFAIDGSANVADVALTIAANSVALGTDTTGDYVQSLVAGAGIALSNNSGESATPTIAVDGVLEDLDTLGAATGDGEFIVSTEAGVFAYESGNTARTSLGLGTSDSPAFSGLTSTENVLIDNEKELRLGELDTNGTEYVAIKSPSALEASYTLTLPPDDGTENFVLITNGSGVLSWSAVTGASGSTNSFSVISVSGQDNLVADTASDTLTFAAGSGISLTTTAGTDTLTIAASNIDNDDIAAAAGIVDTKLATISTADKVSLTAINIDGGDDINADLADADLIIIDDNAAGANRKATLSRVATYINDHSSITTLSKLASVGEAAQTLTAAGNLTVSGNLIVNGDSTTVTTSTLTVQDSLISLAKDNNSADTLDIGFYGLYDTSGTQDLYAGLFRDADDSGKFKLFKDLQVSPTATVNTAGAGYAKATLVADIEGNVTGTVSSLANHDTDDLTEGTNLYFTNTRARAAVSVTDAGGDGSLAYNNGTGVITYTGPSAAEARAHFSGGTGIAIADGVVSIGQSVATDADVEFNQVTSALVGNVTGTVSSLANHDTDSLSEGSNLYHTAARARAAVSVTDSGGDGSLAYNSDTGVITYTGPSATEARAHFSGGTGVTITDGSIAIGQSVATDANVEFNQVTASLSGNASTATKLASARNFEIGDGPITASAIAFDGTGNVSLTSAIADGAIAASKIDIDGATASGNLAATDLILVDHGANGTNRKSTLNQLVSFLQDNTALTSLNSLTSATSLASVGTITSGVWNGTAITDANVANDLTISGGSVNSSPIGASAHSTGKFTTLQATTSLQLASGAVVTGINDTDNMSDASSTTIATSESIKAYVDSQITAQDLDFATDTGAGGTVDLDSQALTIQGTTNKVGVTHSNQTITVNVGSDIVQLTETQTLTNKTLTSPKVTDLNIVDTTITFEGDNEDDHELVIQITEPTADRTITIPDASDTLVGKATVDTFTNKTIDADDGTNSISNLQTSNLKDGVIDTSLTTTADTDTTIPSAKAVKTYVDGKIGRFGGIFKTDSVDGNGIYDVIFSSDPIVRSHFGPFTFNLKQLITENGSDIEFFGATAFGASDRHFEVMPTTDADDTTYGLGETKEGDCLFTGADANTP